MDRWMRILFSPDVPPEAGGDAGGGEAATNAATAPTGAAATPSIPAGHRIVREDEWSRYSQAAQQYDGLRQKFQKHGIEDLNDDALQFISATSKNKQDFKTLNELLYGPNGAFAEQPTQANGTAGGSGLTMEQIEKLLDEREAKSMGKAEAMAQHKIGLSEQDKQLAELRKHVGFPEKIEDDDHYHQLLDLALIGAKIKHGSLYGDDSPLAGQMAPLNGDTFNSLKALFDGFNEKAAAKYQMNLARRAGGGGDKPPTAGDAARAVQPNQTGDDNEAPMTDDERRSKIRNFFDERDNKRRTVVA